MPHTARETTEFQDDPGRPVETVSSLADNCGMNWCSTHNRRFQDAAFHETDVLRHRP